MSFIDNNIALINAVLLLGIILYAKFKSRASEIDEISGRVEKSEHNPLYTSVWMVLRKVILLSYDHLVFTICGSLTLFLTGIFIHTILSAVSPSPLFLILRYGVLVTLLYPFLTGPVYLVRLIAQGEDLSPLDLLRGWRGFGIRGLGLGLLNAGAGGILAGDLLFLLTHPSLALKLAAIPFGYLLLLWLVAQLYGLPLLLHGFSPLRTFRQMFLLVVANPVFTGSVSFVIIALTLLSAVTWLPMMLFTPVFALVAGAVATQALLQKYEALELPASSQSRGDAENSNL